MELPDGNELAAEAKILVRLAHHPRLLRYIGMCLERDPPCLVTELASWGSLSDAMDGIADKLTAAHECTILLQICSGLEMLASEGLVHRDLALRNVLLFEFDENDIDVTSVKVSDFGLAISLYGAADRTVEVGARPIRWFAPESLLYNKFSERSDVWAFGITALELLTRGGIPYIFECPEDAHVVEYVGNSRCTPTRPVYPYFPCGDGSYDELWVLLESCWKHRPLDRPTFAQLSVSLGRMPLPGEVSPPAPAPPASPSAALEVDRDIPAPAPAREDTAGAVVTNAEEDAPGFEDFDESDSEHDAAAALGLPSDSDSPGSEMSVLLNWSGFGTEDAGEEHRTGLTVSQAWLHVNHFSRQRQMPEDPTVAATEGSMADIEGYVRTSQLIHHNGNTAAPVSPSHPVEESHVTQASDAETTIVDAAVQMRAHSSPTDRGTSPLTRSDAWDANFRYVDQSMR